MKTCFIIKGVSGCGKSTRLKVLIDYLSLFLQREDLYTIDVRSGKNRRYAFYFKEINLCIIGRFFEKGKIEKFNGFDDENKKFGNASDFSVFLKNTKMNIVIEGSAILKSNRYRPEFLVNECGFNFVIIQYYLFKTKEQYSQRVLQRSNTLVKETMWENNKSFVKEVEVSKKEADGLPSVVFENNHDVNVNDFGCKLLRFFDMETENFVEYCEIVKYEELNVYKNW